MRPTRFSHFLNDSRWVAHHDGERVDAVYARAAVARLCRQLKAVSDGASAKQAIVFCVFTPIEALIAYFASSHMGLFAALVSPRALKGFLAGQDLSTVAAVVLPRGRALPPDLATVPRLEADFRPGTDVQPAGLPRAASQSCRLVFSSSGTTGAPKRIVLDETRLVANAAVVTEYLGLTAEDRSFCAFPLTFMYGLSTTLCALLSGGEIHYHAYLNTIQLATDSARTGCTVLPILGDWAEGISSAWKALGFSARRLQILNASDRLLRSQAEALLPLATRLWNNFGQTESGPRIFAVNLTEATSLESVTYQGVVAPGRPVHPDIEIRIDAEGSNEGFGPMSYRSPFGLIGYWENNGRIRPASEWIESGDLMRRSEDGLYLWAGRATHTMKVKGELISLRSITDKILLHDGVTGVGYAKGASGVVSVFLECSTAGLKQPVTDQVRKLMRGSPVEVHITPKLPRTESGKVDYRRLAQDTEFVDV